MVFTGPISLLIVTTTAPLSPARSTLLTGLRTIHLDDPLQRLSFHLLYIRPKASFPNAFLNFARLLSETDFVVLFPDTLSTPPDSQLYTLLADKITQRSLKIPTVLSDTSNLSVSMLSSKPLQPLLIDRNHPLWCTERFFLSPSRASDWEECLWEFWLHSLNTLQVLAIPQSGNAQEKSNLPYQTTSSDVRPRIYYYL